MMDAFHMEMTVLIYQKVYDFSAHRITASRVITILTLLLIL
jgi:hypothetical protein